jgi:hypothetical protein
MLGLAMGMLAVAVPARPAPPAGPAAPPGPEARRPCPEGIERFLPGEYYYCVAVRRLAQGRYGEGVDMLETAAGWGSKQAQYVLGLGYYRGDIAPVDKARGLAWLALAAERRDPDYVKVFRSAWQLAGGEDRRRAETLRRQLLPAYGDAHAARRAELRYRRARADLVKGEHNGDRVCIAGLTVDQIPPPPRASPGQLPDVVNLCPGALPVGLAARQLDVDADDLLGGWEGHVQVGALQPADGPVR